MIRHLLRIAFRTVGAAVLVGYVAGFLTCVTITNTVEPRGTSPRPVEAPAPARMASVVSPLRDPETVPGSSDQGSAMSSSDQGSAMSSSDQGSAMSSSDQGSAMSSEQGSVSRTFRAPAPAPSEVPVNPATSPAAVGPQAIAPAPAPPTPSGWYPAGPSVTETVNGYPITYGVGDDTTLAPPNTASTTPIVVTSIPPYTGPLPGDQGCALGAGGC